MPAGMINAQSGLDGEGCSQTYEPAGASASQAKLLHFRNAVTLSA